ncbi:MAG: hypothetical protein HWD61_15155 [Parachlamydiaceae bacterium]|nr:MAG: hypothetical protein HWD61_15155 [Parachlamydiaceae bacterium]
MKEELQHKFRDKQVSDEDLYQFFKQNKIDADHPYFLNVASGTHPTSLALEFAQIRGQTIQNFIGNQYMQEQKNLGR